MAASEGQKKTFWKKGDNTKLPGRLVSMFRCGAVYSRIKYELSSVNIYTDVSSI